MLSSFLGSVQCLLARDVRSEVIRDSYSQPCPTGEEALAVPAGTPEGIVLLLKF
jgi:hypothetical protein